MRQKSEKEAEELTKLYKEMFTKRIQKKAKPKKEKKAGHFGIIKYDSEETLPNQNIKPTSQNREKGNPLYLSLTP